MRGGPLRAPLRLVINLLPVCLPMLVGRAAYTNAGVSAPLIAGLPPLASLSSAHAHGERAGYPGRLPASVTVVHKVGTMYGTENDAAYIVVAQISARTWEYELGRPAFVAPVVATPAAPSLVLNRH